MNHAKCDTLLEASKALLRKSGLARWDDQTFAFVPMYPSNEDYEFEEYWKGEFHSRFGRYMAWVLFSVGAENLAKAACVCNKVVRGKTTSLIYPGYTELIPVDEWVDSVTNENRSHEDEDRATKHNYQPLEKYWKSHLPELRRRRRVCHEESRRLIAGCKYLAQAIRNRDAHTYIADERRKDFPAVEPVFVPAFNILVSAMERNHHFDH